MSEQAVADAVAATFKPLKVPFDFEALLEICKSEQPVSGDFIIEGFVATTDLDLQSDVITAEAIKASEKDLEHNSTVLDNHDPNKRIGKVLFSEARPGGLFVRIRISETVPHIRKQIEEGILNKFSIKGQIIEVEPSLDQKTGRMVNRIKRMYLTHGSLVSVPANTEARSLSWYVVKAYLGGETNMEDKDKDGNDGEKPVVEKGKETAAVGEKPAVEAGATKETPAEVEKANGPEVQAIVKLLDEIKAAAPATAAKVDEIKTALAKLPAPSPAQSAPAPAAAAAKSEEKPGEKPAAEKGGEKTAAAPAAASVEKSLTVSPELEAMLGDMVRGITATNERLTKMEAALMGGVGIKKSFGGDGKGNGGGDNGAGDKSKTPRDRLTDVVAAALGEEVR